MVSSANTEIHFSNLCNKLSEINNGFAISQYFTCQQGITVITFLFLVRCLSLSFYSENNGLAISQYFPHCNAISAQSPYLALQQQQHIPQFALLALGAVKFVA